MQLYRETPRRKGIVNSITPRDLFFCVLPCRELRTHGRAPILPAEIARWNYGESNETVQRRCTVRKFDEIANKRDLISVAQLVSARPFQAKRPGFHSRSIFLTVPPIEWVCGHRRISYTIARYYKTSQGGFALRETNRPATTTGEAQTLGTSLKACYELTPHPQCSVSTLSIFIAQRRFSTAKSMTTIFRVAIEQRRTLKH